MGRGQSSRGKGRLLVGVVVGLLVAATTATAAGLIGGEDVRNGSLTGKDIRNKSLTKRDFRGSVRGPRGARGPRGRLGPTGPTGPAGPAGASGLRTILTFSEGNEITFNATNSQTFVKVRDVGTFSKSTAGSTVRLTLIDHGTRTGTSPYALCAWQLRIDDLNAAGGGDLDGYEAITGSASPVPLFTQSYFEGVAAGTHTVSLWTRSTDGDTCFNNPGNFARKVVVEELP